MTLANALDAATLNVVLLFCLIGTPMILGPVIACIRMYRKLRAQAAQHSPELFFGTSTTASRVLLGCAATTGLIAVATAGLIAPLLTGGPQEKPGFSRVAATTTPASINFCEEDFVHSSLIAEPANVASALLSYPPLALIGLCTTVAAGRPQPWRFAVANSAILAIGLGSGALHGLLTATAQGGDELPMLWYVAAGAFCAIDVILHATRSRAAGRPWVALLVLAAMAAATVVYVARREDFTVFFVCFASLGLLIICCFVWINVGVDWHKLLGERGRAAQAGVLLPISIAIGCCTVLAIWTWMAEMLLCDFVAAGGGVGVGVGDGDGVGVGDGAGGRLARLVWNRCIHPLWHCATALVAYLVVQVLVAAHGLLHMPPTHVPAVAWRVVPCVQFVSNREASVKVKLKER